MLMTCQQFTVSEDCPKPAAVVLVAYGKRVGMFCAHHGEVALRTVLMNEPAAHLRPI